MVVFLLGRRRQRRARQVQPHPAQRLGLVAVGDPGELGDHHIGLGRTDHLEREPRRAVLVLKRTVGGDILGPSVKLFTCTAPRTPCAAVTTPRQTRRLAESIAGDPVPL